MISRGFFRSAKISLWKRKTTSRILLLFIFSVFTFDSVYGDEEVILNKCCPPDTFYDVEQGDCVQTKVTLKDSKNDNSIDRKSYNKDKFTLPETLSVRRSSVLFVNEKNESESEFFSFKLVYNEKTRKCSNGSFIVQIKINESYVMNSNNNSSSKISNRTNSDALFTGTGLLKIGLEYYSKPEYCLSR